MTSLRALLKPVPLLPVLLVAGTALVILLAMQPWLILSATTPTGGDTGAHVYGPAFLRDVLLPDGRILGWSNDWYAGFPAFYFYFPLPSLVIVALDLLVPYGVAFKVVTVLGLLALPPAIYFHARTMNLGRDISLIASGAGGVLAFMESYTIYGANVASTLAGEFTYSWSFALSLVYLGLLIKAVREDRKYLKWAALALAATALTHVITTIVAVFASLFILRWKNAPRRVLLVWGWGFAIAAFWALPLLARIGLSSDMAWTPLTAWKEIFPVELWLLLPVAVSGAVWTVRRTPRAVPLLSITLLPLIYYPLPVTLTELLPGIFPDEHWKLWNGRLLPYWYFGVAFFAAVGLGAGVVWLSRRLPDRVSTHWPRLLLLAAVVAATGLVIDSDQIPGTAWVPVAAGGLLLLALTFLASPTVSTRNFLTASAVGVLVLGAVAGVAFITGWSRWNYEGYETKASWAEYEALMVEVENLPESRVMWENTNDWNKYGTPMSPMLIPYWTEGSHQTMEGVYFESSLTTPFHFITSSEMGKKPSNPIPGLRYHTFDMERGVKHLGVYGVEYYVSFTPDATAKAEEMSELKKVTSTGPFTIFKLPDTELVEVATHLPAVYDVPDRTLLGALPGSDQPVAAEGEPLPSFHNMALAWFEDIDQMHRWVVAGGPEEWPRIDSLDQRPDVALEVPDDAVSNVVIDHHRVSFTTTAVGQPHLVKVSYFPNWEATGAEGPWRATPSLMVVVPTDNEVVLEFTDTWAESFGKGLTVIGLAVLIGAGLRYWWRRPGPAGSDES